MFHAPLFTTRLLLNLQRKTYRVHCSLIPNHRVYLKKKKKTVRNGHCWLHHLEPESVQWSADSFVSAAVDQDITPHFNSIKPHLLEKVVFSESVRAVTETHLQLVTTFIMSDMVTTYLFVQYVYLIYSYWGPITGLPSKKNTFALILLHLTFC